VYPISQPGAAGQGRRQRADDWARPAHPADVAQAQVFDAVLRGEIEEIEALVASMEQRWLLRCERGFDDINRPSEALVRMRGRLAEAQKMLEALRARFPQQ
jgi:hypothetical protein